MPTQTHICFLFIGLFLFTGCSGEHRDKAAAEQLPVVAKKIQKPPASNADTLFIRKSSAVFFQLDSVQMEQYESENAKMVFESTTHECYYQMRNARAALRKNWPGIQIIESGKQRYLAFEKKDKNIICIDLDDKDICGILLFNTQNDPQVTDMMNIDTELENYFGKQH